MENVLAPCSQDWLCVRVVHSRKRELLAAGIPAYKIDKKTEWVRMGYRGNSYPRTTYTANLEYFQWPIDNSAVDACMESWRTRLPANAKVTTYYHCAD